MFGVIVAACVAMAAVGAVAAHLAKEDGTPVPQHWIASEENRTIDVRVEAMPPGDGLRLIFDHVRTTGDRPDGGYFVLINCATGGSTGADNRLANGKFAIGELGTAQTGLPAGGHEFSIVEGRACPA